MENHPSSIRTPHKNKQFAIADKSTAATATWLQQFQPPASRVVAFEDGPTESNKMFHRRTISAPADFLSVPTLAARFIFKNRYPSTTLLLVATLTYRVAVPAPPGWGIRWPLSRRPRRRSNSVLRRRLIIQQSRGELTIFFHSRADPPTCCFFLFPCSVLVGISRTRE